MVLPRCLPLALIGAITLPALGDDTVIRYQVVDLGAPDEHSQVCPCFFTQAASASGEAAGFFFGVDGSYNAFVYRSGEMIDISPPGDNRTFARGMNDAGWVVGWTTVFAPQHGFLHDGKKFHDLGTLGGTYSEARDVNNAGWIVGSASTRPPEDDQHAVLWADGELTDLGTLGGPFSQARAVNERGTIVGWSWNEAWDRRAVYWNPDLSGPFELPSFSDPERHAIAVDVNESGNAVGQIEIEPFENLPRWRAALWHDDEVIDMGVLAEAGRGVGEYGGSAHTTTVARSINDEGVVVGLSSPAAVEPALRPGPFVWRDGAMTNLNDLLVAGSSGWIISDAMSVTNAGTIGGSARTLEDRHSRAVLLVPVEVPRGDLNGDGVVGFDDLLLLLSTWGPCPGCPADLDGDGEVTFGDLLALLANWG